MTAARTELMAEGNFHEALARYEAKGAIHWSDSVDEARAALVKQWAADSAADPAKSRFVFAYTNADVDLLNRELRRVRAGEGRTRPLAQLRDQARSPRLCRRRPDPVHRHRQEALDLQRQRGHHRPH